MVMSVRILSYYMLTLKDQILPLATENENNFKFEIVGGII